MKTKVTLVYILFLIFYGCSSGPKPQAQSSTVTVTERNGQTSEWKLEFPTINQNATPPIIYSLSLTINGTDVSGYYITEVSKSALVGKIDNNIVNFDIPIVSGDLGMKLKGTMINNNIIKGMKELYVSNTKDWTEEDIQAYKKDTPDIPFIATKK